MPPTEFAISMQGTDAARLAAFWSQVLGRPVDAGANEAFAAIGLAAPSPTAGSVWMFHQVPEPKTAKNRMHVDLITVDLPAEVKRVLDLGATHVADVEEDGATLTDPDGNEFDLVAVPSG